MISPDRQHGDQVHHPADDIVAAASQPGVDPCDVALEAMPGHLVGDLRPREIAWLREHTAACSYCADVLHGYERVGSALDRLQAPVPAAAPAPRFVPTKRRADYGRVDSPVGPLFVAVTETGVCEIAFAASEDEALFRARLARRGFAPVANQTAIAPVVRELQEYWGGQRDHFDVPVDLAGVTPFTRAVLTATAEIPFGGLSTYREIAARIGRPRATRAVGNALGRNPVPVIVPCHRVVRSDASLGGYTGGLGIKERLLALEGSTSR